MEKIKSRLPTKEAITPVLAVISFLAYGWTLVLFLWKVPSWMLYLTAGDMLTVLAYSMTSALLESLFVLSVLLLLCLLLPARWMQDVFVTRGTVAAILGLGTIMLYMYCFSLVGYSYISNLIPWSLAGLVITIFFTSLSTRIRPIVRAAELISDRMIVFLYIYIPISLVSLLVVVYRNLF